MDKEENKEFEENKGVVENKEVEKNKGAVKNKDNNTIGIVSLILGCLSIVFCFIPILNIISLITAIISIILGIVAIVKKCKIVFPLIGIIVSVLVILWTIIQIVFFASAFSFINSTWSDLKKSKDTEWNDTMNTVINEAKKQKEQQEKEETTKQKSIVVTLGEFTITNIGSSASSNLPVTIKNTYKSTLSGSVHIKAVDASNNVIAEDDVLFSSLGSGQSITEDSFDLVDSSKYEALKTAKFSVTEVNVF